MPPRAPRLAVVLALASACAAPGTDAADTDGAADTGVLPVDEDCPVDPALFEEVQAELGEVQTVIRASWRTSTPVEARVAYVDGADGEVRYTPVGAAGATGAVNVLGLLPSRAITLQVEALVAGERRCSAPRTVTTGTLASDLPATVVTVDDAARAVRGWQSVAVIRPSNRYAAILDADGQFVWAWSVPGIFRATLARDGVSMLVNQPASVWNGVGILRRIPLEGGEGEAIEVPGAHTDFVELPDGTLATLGWTRRSFEGDTRYLLGDTIIEVRPDGTQVQVWDVFDDFDPYLGVVYGESPASGEGEPLLEEWSHVNSIWYDEASDDYLVTASFDHGVIRIDRATGARVWTLADGGGATDWTVVSDQRELELPHSAQLVDEDTVLAFSRGPLGSPDAPEGCAWVTELALAGGVATPRWHYAGDDCLTVGFLGQARRIPEGNTLLNWTVAGRISQTDADGAVVFQVDLGLGAAFGSGEWAASLY